MKFTLLDTFATLKNHDIFEFEDKTEYGGEYVKLYSNYFIEKQKYLNVIAKLQQKKIEAAAGDGYISTYYINWYDFCRTSGDAKILINPSNLKVTKIGNYVDSN